MLTEKFNFNEFDGRINAQKGAGYKAIKIWN